MQSLALAGSCGQAGWKRVEVTFQRLKQLGVLVGTVELACCGVLWFGESDLGGGFCVAGGEGENVGGWSFCLARREEVWTRHPRELYGSLEYRKRRSL